MDRLKAAIEAGDLQYCQRGNARGLQAKPAAFDLLDQAGITHHKLLLIGPAARQAEAEGTVEVHLVSEASLQRAVGGAEMAQRLFSQEI